MLSVMVARYRAHNERRGRSRREALMDQFQKRSRISATMLLAGGLLLWGGMTSTAQEGTPAAGGDDHPAHIHVGSCENLDPNPTYMLTNVAAPAGPSDATNGAAIPVERSTTQVEDSLENLRTAGYAIVVHHSVDDIGTYIACGNLTGELDAGGSLVVGLSELNGSSHTGIAILSPNGDETDVNLYLTQASSGAVSATPEAAAMADHQMAASDAVEVAIKDLAYNPATLTVPVGSTVTWTNDDTVPHTVTAKDRAALQSGTLDAGQTYRETFDDPGTFDYFCEFHANMKGSIIVE